MIVLVLESFVGGAGGPIDNFRVSSRSKVFCNSTEFFTNKFKFFPGGGGSWPAGLLCFLLFQKFHCFFISYTRLLKRICAENKLSLEQSIKSRFVDKSTLVAVISGVIPLVITTVFIVAQLC